MSIHLSRYIVLTMQTIVTHSGSFDPDDVLAVAALKLYLVGVEVKIVRSRDKKVIDDADWVIDVGGCYDLATQRFDHHQNGLPLRDNSIPYSAFGLVWKEFGVSICDSEEVADRIEKRLVFPIDAADNHIPVSKPSHPDIEPFEFFDVIDVFKPVWGSDEDFDSEFHLAVEFAQKLLERMIKHAKGKVVINEMIQDRYDSSEDKSILIFSEPVPRYSLVDYEDVKIIVSPVPATDVPNWMAGVVPKKGETFVNKVNFPEKWTGLSDDELVEASGIDEAVFCHKERYVFVAKTKAGALAAARKAIA